VAGGAGGGGGDWEHCVAAAEAGRSYRARRQGRAVKVGRMLPLFVCPFVVTRQSEGFFFCKPLFTTSPFHRVLLS
jgi:hypothetical protein